MKKFVIALLGIVSFSCSNNPVPKPKVLLEYDVMKDIMFDVAILQAAESTVPNGLMESSVKPNTYIYEKYKIDSLTYYQNQKYYAADTKKYKKMHQQVLERFNEVHEKLAPEAPPIENNQPEVK